MPLWYPEVGPHHTGQNFKLFGAPRWSGLDNQERFDANMANPETRKKMEQLGWTDPDTIEYRYNHQGFRGDEFDDRPAGIAVGCSHTMGTGNRQHETWPHVLSTLLNMHVWNLGTGGSGIDTNFRLLDHYIKILKPRFVVHAVPSIQRFEVCIKDKWQAILVTSLGEHETLRPFCQEYFLNPVNSEMNAKRNLMAIRYLCHTHDVPYYALDVARAMDLEEAAARDLWHPGPVQQRIFAEYMHDFMKHNPKGALDGHTRIRCS